MASRRSTRALDLTVDTAFDLLNDILDEEGGDENENESDIDEDLITNLDLEEEEDDDSQSQSESAEPVPGPVPGPSRSTDDTPGPSRSTDDTPGPSRSTDATDWSQNLHNINVEPFTEAVGPTPDQLDALLNAPVQDFFLEFIPEIFFVKMAKETNIYAAENDAPSKWQKVTADDMKLFFYINIMFGIHQLPTYAQYWSTDELLGVPAVSSVMTRTRYELISRYFHLNSNADRFPRDHPNYDPIHKVRPLFDTVRLNSAEKFLPGRDISIDEAMIAFTGRLHFKQYIKNKPTPWGIKLWCAADSATGYLLDFSVYAGKSKVSTNGLGYDVVMAMGSRYLEKHHHFFYDNFFSSVKLAKDLLSRETYSCSTIRTNRKGWPKKFSSTTRAPTQMRQIGNVVATFWFDKRAVNILSTNANPVFTTVTRRAPGGRVNKDIPEAVDIYNKGMGGVDLHDQYRAYYPVGRRSRKWWRCLVWFLVQVAICNGYHLYSAVFSKSVRTDTKLTPMKFRLELLRWLKASGSSRKRAAPETARMARGSDTHTPVRLSGRKKTCYQCRKDKVKTASGKQRETVYGCSKCQIHLCEGACYAKFHKDL